MMSGLLSGLISLYYIRYDIWSDLGTISESYFRYDIRLDIRGNILTVNRLTWNPFLTKCSVNVEHNRHCSGILPGPTLSCANWKGTEPLECPANSLLPRKSLYSWNTRCRCPVERISAINSRTITLNRHLNHLNVAGAISGMISDWHLSGMISGMISNTVWTYGV